MVDVIPTATGNLPVRAIKFGEKITEPGVYAMPMLWYHGDCCAGPSISSSGLRRIISHSPLHYWDQSPLNPDSDDDAEDELGQKEAVRLGRAAHTLLLEPDTFKGNFVTRPTMWDSWRSHDARKWRTDQVRLGRTVVDGAEMIRVSSIVTAIKAHPIAADLLDGDIELSLIWRDHRTGVWLKARPDAIPRGSNILADLKCLRDVRDDALRRTVFAKPGRHDGAGYDMQLALTGVGFESLLGRQVEDHVLVATESKRPFAIVCRPISPDEIFRARCYLRRAIDTFAECCSTGEWPGPFGDTSHLGRSKWDQDEFERDQKSGLIPQDF